jgi:hypothetical protein
MDASELIIRVNGTEAFERVGAALGEADDEMPGKIRKELVLLANRLAYVASRAALAEPTHGAVHTGLRESVSHGVGVRETDDGAVVTTSMPVPDEAVIPRGLDAHGWRHPVFGNRNNWVVQHGAFSWFMDSMQGGRTDGEQNLERMLNEVAEKIAAAAE